MFGIVCKPTGAALTASRATIRHRHTINADLPAGLNQSDDCEGGALMSQTIELSDESVALLKRQADAHGLTVDGWVQALARAKTRMDDVYPGRQKAQAAAPRILEIQKRVKPDPDGRRNSRRHTTEITSPAPSWRVPDPSAVRLAPSSVRAVLRRFSGTPSRDETAGGAWAAWQPPP
jgi:hypothetical protein